MCCHEIKACTRCGASFECKAGSIMQCHCMEVTLSVEERSCLEQRYSDCLCNNCLLSMKELYKILLEETMISYEGRQ